jgi:hypothetical protein
MLFEKSNCKLLTFNLNKMKKIGKLNINPEKVMKNEELLTLKGGYSYWTCDPVVCPGETNSNWYGSADSEADAMRNAEDYYEWLFQLPEHSCDADNCWQ